LEGQYARAGSGTRSASSFFTEYRATQKWLYDLLARHGFAEERRLELIYGGMPSDERERIKAAFQANPKDSVVRILLATDAASEGVNLQNHCSKLIHYEIPWNPNRMEQRNGRRVSLQG
jgi:superfamily II DNA/RNA helicase